MSLIKRNDEKEHTVYSVLGLRFKFRTIRPRKRVILLKKREKVIKLKKFFAKFLPCKKYKYIIPFGMNCDFSKVFLEYFQFNDSTFWNWVYADNANVQIDVMNNYDIVFSQGLNVLEEKNMYLCKKTNLCFHGRSLSIKNPDGTINEQKLKEDKEELFSRMRYLHKKTSRYLDSDDKKLITYTVICNDQSRLKQMAQGINDLYEYLLTRTKNFDFLVICPKHHYKTIHMIVKPKHPEIYIKKIKSNRNSGIRLYGDKIGWADIFAEFRPEKIIKSKYKELKFNQLEHDRLNV